MAKAQSRQVQPAPSLRRHLRHPVRYSQLRRLRIASAIADYLADVGARRSLQAADRLKQLLSDFRRSCHRIHLRAINRRDLIAYMTALRDRGLADRTIFNRTSTVLTFLRSFGVEGLLSRPDLPRYTQKSVDAYSEAEIAQLLRAGNEKSRVICGFFLGTGCREQEVAYMTWNDVSRVAILNRGSEWRRWEPHQHLVRLAGGSTKKAESVESVGHGGCADLKSLCEKG